MAPKKNLGGAGNKTAQSYVAQLWEQGLSEQDVRKQLKESGYKAGRISQLMKATRPASALTATAKRPAAAEGFTNAEARLFSWLVLTLVVAVARLSQVSRRVAKRPAAASGPKEIPEDRSLHVALCGVCGRAPFNHKSFIVAFILAIYSCHVSRYVRSGLRRREFARYRDG